MEDKKNDGISMKVWMMKKKDGLVRIMEDTKNDAISKKVWMIKKKSWVRTKYGR